MIEKIEWKSPEPASFPCFVCEVGEATFRRTIDMGGCRLLACLCNKCVMMGEVELVAFFETD